MAEPNQFKMRDRAFMEWGTILDIANGRTHIVEGTIVREDSCNQDPNNKGLAWRPDGDASEPTCIGPNGIKAQLLTKIIDGKK